MIKFISIVLCSFMFQIGFVGPVFATNTKTTSIFLIHSYLPGLWTNEAAHGLRDGFMVSNITAEIREHIYDYLSYRNQSQNILNREILKIKRSIIEHSSKLIVIFDDEAADALIGPLSTLKIPIVVAGINKNEEDIDWFKPLNASKRFFTGVLERYPFEQSLRMLHMINPEITEISILSSENATSKIVSKQIVNSFRRYGGAYSGIKLKNVHLTSSWNNWKTIIESYKGKSKAFWILVPWNVNDEKGKEVDLRRIGTFYRTHSRLPSLGIVNIHAQLGFLASFSVSAEDLGFQAAQMASTILKENKAPRDIPFEVVKTVRFIVNKKRADDLGYKIPFNLLEFAEIEKKIPMKFVR